MQAASSSEKPTLPAYEQVKAFVRGHISRGAWRPGDLVPSESALCEQFAVARMTVNRALRDLAADGLVTRIKGSGTRVAALNKVSSRLTIRDIHDEVAERGHVHTTQVLRVGQVQAADCVAATLGLAKGAAVFHSLLVHFENAVPIQLEDRYVNPAAAPGYLALDFEQTTPTHHLLQVAPITEASYSIEACVASATEAKHLALRKGDACLAMLRRTVSGPHVASWARLLYPGSRYSFAGQFAA